MRRSRFRLVLMGLSVLLFAGMARAADRPVWLATPAAEGVSWQSDTPGATPPAWVHGGNVPLGSVWKLFVWIYLEGSGAQESPYFCAGGTAQAGEEYCCEAGQPVGRNLALARSCGAYFEPLRLGIKASAWRRWWRQREPGSAWLAELSNIRPDYRLPVADLLHTLQEMPEDLRGSVRSALGDRLMQPNWQDFLAHAGSGYRFKTFTWDNPDRPGSSMGGSVGWLASGQAFWVGGEGGSQSVMQRASQVLPRLLPLPDRGFAAGMTGACVDVSFFAHYPLHAVLDEGGQPVQVAGSLPGRVHFVFSNGQRLDAVSDGQLQLGWKQGVPALSARFPLEEYVARVVDREGEAREVAAAQALAVAARSWLVQNAAFEHGCWQVADDSRMQRVSPSPPTASAWRAAWFTEGLVLKGQPVMYHQNHADDGRLSWVQAAQASRGGQDFAQIAMAAFPRASFSILGGQDSCERLPQAEQWLQQHLPRARQRLYEEPGFEPVNAVTICELNYGNPYSDQRQQRIWVRRLDTLDDRVTLWHEYLHIAFRHHPNGWNEAYLEQLARQLAEGI